MMALMETMLTTDDNPFSPFDEFESWHVWDVAHGYHTLSYLGRVVQSSPELSDADQLLAQTQAIDEILKENPLNYLKVEREYIPETIPLD